MNKFIFSILLFSITNFILNKPEDSSLYKNSNSDTWITIFIHGSFSLRPHITLGNILKMLNDSIEESIYYRSTEINRHDPFFYKNQAMGPLGLHLIDMKHPNKITAAPILAAAFEEVCRQAGHQHSKLYYTFGWSGLVSNKLRYLEADLLHLEIKKLLNDLKAQGIIPKLRVIGYSHGGNLALQLGALHATKKPDQQFIIDELFLIGTPIQVETDYLINSPIFKKVFNIYSRADKVQKLDFFSFKRFFSKKKFQKRYNFRLPEKLYQLRIKISDYKPRTKYGHSLQTIPTDKNLLKKHFRECNYDPGHFELWFMGWTILTYRQEFPLYPLPLLTFLPLIAHYLETEPKLPHDLVVHIIPRLGIIDFTAYHPRKHLYSAQKPFLEKELLDHMKTHTAKYKPDDYNIKIYNNKVYGAINIAQNELEQIKNISRQANKSTKNLKQTINLHENKKKAYNGHLPDFNDMAC